MMVRLAIGLLTLLLLLGLADAEHAIANGGPWEIKHEIDTGIVTWNDQDSEAAYRVSGTIINMDLSCAGPEGVPGDTLDFSEELPTDTTTFQLPPPGHNGALSVKDLEFKIEALDANGEVIEQDGFARIVDGFCFDEGLPSTGADFEGQSSDRLLIAIALLFILGTASLFGGLITLKRGT